jgi:hypothetical protein
MISKTYGKSEKENKMTKIDTTRKNIEESLKLVKLLQELGCGGYYTEDSLCEVLDDIENLEIHGRTDKPGEVE